MRQFLIVFSLACALLQLQACNKNKNNNNTNPSSGTGHYYFANKTGKDIVLRIFGDNPFIFPGRPLLREYEINAGVTMQMPDSGMIDSLQYYYEWFTKDFTKSSWPIPAYQPWSDLLYYLPTVTDTTFLLDRQPRIDRMILRTGDGSMTQWKAVDAYDLSGNSVWASLTPAERVHNIYIDRRLEFRDSMKTAAGLDSGYGSSVAVWDTTSTFQFSDYGYLNSFFGGHTLGTIAPLHTSSTDTMFLVHFKDNIGPPISRTYGYIFKLAKIKTFQKEMIAP